MAAPSVLRNLLVKLNILSEQGDDGTAPDKGGKARPTRTKDLVDFEVKLDKILKRRRSDVADHVYLLDLSKLRKALGPDKWDGAEEKITAAVRTVIEARSTPNDLYTRHGEYGYLLVFPALGLRGGQLKTKLIAEEIARKLFGDDRASSVVTVKAGGFAADGRIEFKDAPPIERLFDDMAETIKKLEDVAPPSPPPAPPNPDAPPGLEDVRFVFRPMLTVRGKVISTFMCLPIRPVYGGFRSGYEVLEPGSRVMQILALDLMALKHAAKSLEILARSKGRSLLALAVNFETLADPRARSRFIPACTRLLTAEHRKHLVIELVDLPGGIPQNRLLEMVGEVNPFARSVIARFAIEHTSFPAFRVAGLHAVGVDIFRSTLTEEALMRKMRSFVVAAQQNQLKTYILGVRSLSLYTAAVTEGFDYMAGYALTEVAQKAEDIYQFQLDQPYLSLLGGLENGSPRD